MRGVHAKTHAGLIQSFGQQVKQAPVLSRLSELRAEADYSMEGFTRSREHVERAIDDAEAFVERCAHLVAERLEAGPDEEDPPPDL